MTKVLLILLAGVFTNNIVCHRCVGIDGGVLSSDTMRRSLFLGVFSTLSALLCQAVCYPLYFFLLTRLGADFLFTLLYTLISAAIIFGAYRLSPFLVRQFDRKMLTVSCGISLGMACLSAAAESYLFSLLSVVSYGLGLLVVLLVFYCVRLSLKEARVPQFLRGTPLDLIIVSIIALVFLGLS